MDRRIRQNLGIGIVFCIGILLILSVVWVLSKQYRFREYRNERKGFSVKYPAAWAFEENKNGAAVIFFSPTETELDFFRENVNVVVQETQGEPKTLRQYSDLAIKQMELVFEKNFVLLESMPIRFAGREGYKIVFLGKGPDTELKYMCVWTLDGVKAYQLTYTALSSQYDRYVSKMKRMVRSFHINGIPQ